MKAASPTRSFQITRGGAVLGMVGRCPWLGLAIVCIVRCGASSQSDDPKPLQAEETVSELREKALASVEDVKKLNTQGVTARQSMEVALRRELARLDVRPAMPNCE